MEETSNIDNDRYILWTRLICSGIKDWAKQNQSNIEMLELTKLSRWLPKSKYKSFKIIMRLSSGKLKRANLIKSIMEGLIVK